MRIPYYSSSERAAPLQRCIDKAAREMGMSEYVVATVMSHFLEQIEEEVARGRMVRLPGFGAFGPKLFRGTPVTGPRYYPAFSSARCWKNLMRMFCKPSPAELEAIQQHRRRHNPSEGCVNAPHSSSRPFTAHRSFREKLLQQARKLGREAGLPCGTDSVSVGKARATS